MEALTAMLCANSEKETQQSKDAQNKVNDATRSIHNGIRTKINRLVLAILRVKPYQERLERIFTHPYESADDLEASPTRNKGFINDNKNVDNNLESGAESEDEGISYDLEMRTNAADNCPINDHDDIEIAIESKGSDDGGTQPVDESGVNGEESTSPATRTVPKSRWGF